MILGHRDNVPAPRVARHRGRNSRIGYVAMTIGIQHFYLTPEEALNLADRLVDTAEGLTRA
ncbi:MAG: hypothetical protein ACTH7R_10650 [Corynebacterium flavescens]|uniref:hypothetical protein n=1 Tax=Corynebacterium flavescens TaxID=28028 RepID=UPI003F9399CB